MTPPAGRLTGAVRRSRIAACAIGLLLLGGLGAGVVLRAARRAELRAARELLSQDDPAAARDRLDHYLARWPADADALLLAARAARRCDACADAERFLTALEQKSGPTAASRWEWLLLGAQQGDFAGHEAQLRSYVEQDHPDAPAILEALAKGYDASYRWSNAMAALNLLVKRSPGHVPALLLRGADAERLGRPADAEQDFRRAVGLAPQRAAPHVALAGFLNRKGYPREAIYHYELALRLKPDDAATLLGLARALADSAEVAEAERQLDELLAADPDCVEALVERGRLALRLGRPAEAEPFLARAARAAPWHRDGHRLYLAALTELGHGEEASRCQVRLAELAEEDAAGGRLMLRAHDAPADPGVRLELWQWSRRNGRVEEGHVWLTEILRAAPGDPAAEQALADYFDGAGEPRRAALHREGAEHTHPG